MSVLVLSKIVFKRFGWHSVKSDDVCYFLIRKLFSTKFVKRKGLTNSGLKPEPNMPNLAEAQLSKGDRISC